MRVSGKNANFAPLSRDSTKGLDYGVMAAQQVLVLFVLVRIQVVQPKEHPQGFISHADVFLCLLEAAPPYAECFFNSKDVFFGKMSAGFLKMLYI